MGGCFVCGWCVVFGCWYVLEQVDVGVGQIDDYYQVVVQYCCLYYVGVGGGYVGQQCGFGQEVGQWWQVGYGYCVDQEQYCWGLFVWYWCDDFFVVVGVVLMVLDQVCYQEQCCGDEGVVWQVV